MSGQSYHCGVCNSYLGRGRAARDRHQVPEDCIKILEKSVKQAEAHLFEVRATLLDVLSIQDSGETDRHKFILEVWERHRRRVLREEQRAKHD